MQIFILYPNLTGKFKNRTLTLGVDKSSPNVRGKFTNYTPTFHVEIYKSYANVTD